MAFSGRFVVPMVLLCWPACGLADEFRGSASAEQPSDFGISIDERMLEKWGCQYPVTYVFHVSDISGRTTVLQRDADSDPWRPIERKTSEDVFNGVSCVRFEQVQGKAYVSVGFGKTGRIELRFVDAGSVKFDEVAKYYDARKAAFTLSNDNWGRQITANSGAPWKGMTDDASDKYQASVHACRMYHLPVSVGINSRMNGGRAVWERMQKELDRGDRSWEPVVHTRTHPCSEKAYRVGGYTQEIVGCRDDILQNLRGIPYGQYVFEFIPPCAYQDDAMERAAAGEFLFVRDWNGRDNPASTGYLPWNSEHRYYGIGGRQTKSYDAVMEARRPKGRYYAEDVAALNGAFDRVLQQGGIFYAMWHADRYANSVLYDPRRGVDGVAGSTLMQHFAHVANRPNVWYVANGWLYCYRFVAQRTKVSRRGVSVSLRAIEPSHTTLHKQPTNYIPHQPLAILAGHRKQLPIAPSLDLGDESAALGCDRHKHRYGAIEDRGGSGYEHPAEALHLADLIDDKQIDLSARSTEFLPDQTVQPTCYSHAADSGLAPPAQFAGIAVSCRLFTKDHGGRVP